MSGPRLTVLPWEVWGTLKGVASLKDVASRGEDCIYPLPYSLLPVHYERKEQLCSITMICPSSHRLIPLKS